MRWLVVGVVRIHDQNFVRLTQIGASNKFLFVLLQILVRGIHVIFVRPSNKKTHFAYFIIKKCYFIRSRGFVIELICHELFQIYVKLKRLI